MAGTDDATGNPDPIDSGLINEKCVLLGYQIYHYADRDQRQADTLKSDVQGLAAYVVAYYKPPEQYELSSPEDSDAIRRTRGNSKGPTSLGYLQEWRVDKSKLQDAIKAFMAGTFELCRDKDYRRWIKEYNNVLEDAEKPAKELHDASGKGKKKAQDPPPTLASNSRNEVEQERRRSTESISRGSSLPLRDQHYPSLAKDIPYPSNQSIREGMWGLNLDLADIVKVRALLEKTRRDAEASVRSEILSQPFSQLQQKENIHQSDQQRDNPDNVNSFSKSQRENGQRRKSKQHRSRDQPSDDSSDDSESSHKSFRKRNNHHHRRRRHKHCDQISESGSDSDSWNRQEDRRFNPEEVGFFDPFLVVKDSEDDGEVVNFGNKTYYRNVHLFIDAFKDVDESKDSGVVRRNLNKCLRGAAQEWYIGQLTRDERQDMKDGRGVKRWEKALLRRFRKTQSSALKALDNERYTVKDARNNKQTSEFVTRIIRHAKDADIMTTSAQLTYAWNKLDPDLRGFIKRPKPTTTVTDFMEEMEDMMEVWHDKYAKQPESRSSLSQRQLENAYDAKQQQRQFSSEYVPYRVYPRNNQRY